MACEAAGVNTEDLERVRSLWRELTTARSGFAGEDLVYAATNSHRAAPDGWVAIVRLGRGVVVAGPDAQLDRIDRNTRQSTPTQLVSAAHIDEFVRPLHTLGPARLYYGAPAGHTPARSTLGPLPVDDDRVQSVLADATDAERGESGVAATTSGVFVALADDATPAAAAGWTVWPHDVAHICVLTATAHRGTGAGLAAAHRALTEAVAAGLLPQWRSAKATTRPPPSLSGWACTTPAISTASSSTDAEPARASRRRADHGCRPVRRRRGC